MNLIYVTYWNLAQLYIDYLEEPLMCLNCRYLGSPTGNLEVHGSTLGTMAHIQHCTSHTGTQTPLLMLYFTLS